MALLQHPNATPQAREVRAMVLGQWATKNPPGEPRGSVLVVPVEYPEVSDTDEDKVEPEGQEHGVSFQLEGRRASRPALGYRCETTSIRWRSLRRRLSASLNFRLTMISTV